MGISGINTTALFLDQNIEDLSFEEIAQFVHKAEALLGHDSNKLNRTIVKQLRDEREKKMKAYIASLRSLISTGISIAQGAAAGAAGFDKFKKIAEPIGKVLKPAGKIWEQRKSATDTELKTKADDLKGDIDRMEQQSQQDRQKSKDSMEKLAQKMSAIYQLFMELTR